MMILIDTQVVVWGATDDARLGRHARDRIAASPAVFVSAISVLELTIKAMNGKFVLPLDFLGSLSDQGFAPLPMEFDDAAGLRDFPSLTRHDPFDRVLLSQAKRSGSILLTADRALLALGLDFVVSARD